MTKNNSEDNDTDRIPHQSLYNNELGYLPRVGNWEYDVVNETYTWSDAIFDILELPYDTKPNNTFALRFYAEPYQSMLKKAIAKAYQAGSPWDLELEATTANNRTIWVRSYGNAVVENDVVVRVRGILMDIDKYRTNETSFNLLKQRHKQLSSFTHVLTHNLRNHASNISLLSSLIDRDELDANNADLIEKITNVADHLSTTIEHLSEVMKVNENMIESDLLNFDERMGSTLTILSTELDQSGASIETDFTVPAIFFPKLYLDSILMNLISNSIKYKKELERPEILISTYLDEEKNCVILEYQDNGIGIDLEKYGDQVFGLYKTFTNRPGAHGVGLFLVRTQIESQGGYIIIESKPDVGTIFRIFFKPGSHVSAN